MTTDSISALGSYGGLGGAGLYGSYYDPYMSMMGGYSGLGMTNPMMMSGMGTMGMYNPTFMQAQVDMMKNMYSAQNEINKMQLNNATEMHEAKEMAQVHNVGVHDRAFFETVMKNGEVQNGVRNIYDAVRKSDMDDVVQKYYELKQMILNKFNDHFTNSPGGINDRNNIDKYISDLYAEIGGGLNPGAPKPDLRQDIEKFGETPFEHGMSISFLGNSGHNKLTAEECLNQIYGTRINDAGSKAKAEKAGKFAGRVKEAGLATGLGAVLGLGTIGLGRIAPITKLNNLCKGKFKAAAWIGALGLAAADILWQATRA